MSTSNKSRNGNRSLNRTLNRVGSRYGTVMLGGLRRPPRPNDLQLACRLINKAVRIHEHMARRDPHLFGPHARRYYRDTLRLAQYEQEIDTAIRKVYGPLPPGTPEPVSKVWTDRYVFRTPHEHRLHLRWFREHYGK